MTTKEIKQRLEELGDPVRADSLRRFFKTGPGEYGEGDIFLGIRVPVLRKLAKEYQAIRIDEARELLASPVHEVRLLALLILIGKYKTGSEATKEALYELYMRNLQFINNWDLVDVSAEHIIGDFLVDKSKKPIYRLARSRILWERRIAIMATFHFVKRGRFTDTLKISKTLLGDQEDLIQKAVGWMLREVGKRDMSTEESFLKEHYQDMPRTMLRYAIERFPEPKREKYLKGKI
jgi:3-methyladenine DNA glycosylase AlkD